MIDAAAGAHGVFLAAARRPGVVLRVQQMRALVPFDRLDERRRSRVATPQRWPRKLSATRSAVEHAARRAGQRRDARRPAATRVPSGRSILISIAGSTRRKASRGESSPATTPGWRAHQRRFGARRCRHDRIRRDVAGPAEVLEQRGADRAARNIRAGRERLPSQASSMRSTARRARAATAGSIVTSCCIVSSAWRMLAERDPLHVRAEVAGPHELDRRDAATATLSLIEHSVISTTFGGRSSARHSRSSPPSSRRNPPRPPPPAGIRGARAR